MDPYLHTFLSLGSIFVAYHLGHYFGAMKGHVLGIAATLLFFKTKISPEIMMPVERSLMLQLETKGLDI